MQIRVFLFSTMLIPLSACSNICPVEKKLITTVKVDDEEYRAYAVYPGACDDDTILITSALPKEKNLKSYTGFDNVAMSLKPHEMLVVHLAKGTTKAKTDTIDLR